MAHDDLLALGTCPMRDRLLIGLSGKAAAGKDTVMTMLGAHLTRYGASVVRAAFADALKLECSQLHGWNGIKDEAGRTLLQQVGVRRRAEDPMYWVRKAFEQINFLAPRTVYVITDVRFRNEANYVKEQGGEMWRIERRNPDGSRFDNGLSISQQEHPSETDLDLYPFDRVLYNDLGLGYLDIEVGSTALQYSREHSLWFGR